MSNKIYYYENVNQVLKLKLPETLFFFKFLLNIGLISKGHF